MFDPTTSKLFNGTDVGEGYNKIVFGSLSISSSPSCFGQGNFLPLKMQNSLLNTLFIIFELIMQNFLIYYSIIKLYLKMLHFPDSNAKFNIGAVLRHLLTSAGCCSIMIFDAGVRGLLGNPGHQQTPTGRLNNL